MTDLENIKHVTNLLNNRKPVIISSDNFQKVITHNYPGHSPVLTGGVVKFTPKKDFVSTSGYEDMKKQYPLVIAGYDITIDYYNHH